MTLVVYLPQIWSRRYDQSHDPLLAKLIVGQLFEEGFRMSFDQRLQELTRELGADFVGVADLSSARDAIREQGGEKIAAYPLAVSVGIRVMDTIIDELPHAREDRGVALNFRQHGYDIVNDRLNALTSRTASFLQNSGYRALPIPASQRVDDKKLLGAFSHKLAAHLAGLGWIGKSCLLVTPQAGPRVRWATVLTDAPLAVTGQPMESRCGKCTSCVDTCPVGAFTGRIFAENEPRSARFDVSKCNDYQSESEKITDVRVCGLCVYACPHGQKKHQASA
jgi:epoxyqueuosine reductase QueG